MITKVRIQNYRSLRDVTVELGPLTVLVGRNGSGKSNFLDALTFLHEAVTDSLANAVKRRYSGLFLAHQPSEGRLLVWSTIEVDGVAGEDHWRYVVELDLAASRSQHRAMVRREAAYRVVDGVPRPLFEWSDGQWRTAPSGTEPGALDGALFLPLVAGLPEHRRILHALESYRCYHLDTVTVAPVDAGSGLSALDADGGGLAAVLHLMRGTEPMKSLQDALQRLLGFELQIHTRELTPDGPIYLELTRGPGTQKPLRRPADLESAGVIRLLRLLVALHQPEPPRTIAIEEPEAHLHPQLMAALADALAETAERAQLLVTTQSPDLISRIDPACLRVVQWVDGASQIGRLSSADLGIINDELFSGGDLLRIKGLDREVA